MHSLPERNGATCACILITHFAQSLTKLPSRGSPCCSFARQIASYLYLLLSSLPFGRWNCARATESKSKACVGIPRRYVTQIVLNHHPVLISMLMHKINAVEYPAANECHNKRACTLRRNNIT